METETDEKSLHEKLQVLKDEEKAAQESIERAMDYVHEGGKKISGWMKTNDMMQVEAEHKLLEFGIWPRKVK